MKALDIHQANVIGLGAHQFAQGLVTQIERNDSLSVCEHYLHRTMTENFSSAGGNTVSVSYYLGFLSRIFEIFFWKYYRKGINDLVVLGDLPLNTSVKQYVLCHQSLMFNSFSFISPASYKFLFFRLCYIFFLKADDIVLVQSEPMKFKFHSKISNKINVKVITLDPVFCDISIEARDRRICSADHPERLNLVYPSAFYPHKNHYLLDEIAFDKSTRITVTITSDEFPAENDSVYHIGRVSRDDIFELYKEVDALLFLSGDESLGMPIFEAIKSNLPIICPRADYTVMLEGENCFYFDVNDPLSLEKAISLLRQKLNTGWWPQWPINEILEGDNRVKVDKLILGL